MRAITGWAWILHVGLIHSFTLFQKPMLKRFMAGTHMEESNIPCIHMESSPGEYHFTSPGSGDVCGLYIIGQPDQLIRLHFTHFDIDCSQDSLLAVVDGWELQGQYFPSDYDHPKSDEERSQGFCGEEKPQRYGEFISYQNAALIQYRIPTPGQGFRVRVTMPHNPRPCNVVSMMEEGAFTLKNYGLRINCSMSIVYPELIHVLSIDVGETSEVPAQTKETGLTRKCEKRGREDFVELRDGSGLDPRTMTTAASICGLSANPKPSHFPLACQHTVVRLVSSGKYYNSVTFSFNPPSYEDIPPEAFLNC